MSSYRDWIEIGKDSNSAQNTLAKDAKELSSGE
jgi:hypothetical protein